MARTPAPQADNAGSTPARVTLLCSCGEIGRHACLKSRCLRACGFDPHLEHLELVMSQSVRFLQSFIMTVVQTTVDGDGNLQVVDSQVHIRFGEVYPITDASVSGNTMSIQFASNSPIQGTAPSVDTGFVEITGGLPPTMREQLAAVASETQPTQKKSGCGCGG
jgi:hypothetical protein